MLNLNQVMLGSDNPTQLAAFYEKVLDKKPDWHDGNWYGWQAGNSHLTIGEHSEVLGKAKEPQRVMFNFEVEDVKEEFARLKGSDVKVIAKPYEMEGMWIATLADPDGNYFQLMSPWEAKH